MNAFPLFLPLAVGQHFGQDGLHGLLDCLLDRVLHRSRATAWVNVYAVSIPVGGSKTLGTVDVHSFERIRVVADERVGSVSNGVIRLTITEGSELVAQLDTLTLAPHSQLTRVYEVPGTKLTVSADAVGTGSGSASVDVLIYGYSE